MNTLAEILPSVDAQERWLPVLGYESLYHISDSGRVRRIGKAARKGYGRGGGAVIGRILSQLSRAHGLDRKTLRSAITGKTWRHVL